MLFELFSVDTAVKRIYNYNMKEKLTTRQRIDAELHRRGIVNFANIDPEAEDMILTALLDEKLIWVYVKDGGLEMEFSD